MFLATKTKNPQATKAKKNKIKKGNKAWKLGQSILGFVDLKDLDEGFRNALGVECGLSGRKVTQASETDSFEISWTKSQSE